MIKKGTLLPAFAAGALAGLPPLFDEDISHFEKDAGPAFFCSVLNAIAKLIDDIPIPQPDPQAFHAVRFTSNY